MFGDFNALPVLHVIGKQSDILKNRTIFLRDEGVGAFNNLDISFGRFLRDFVLARGLVSRFPLSLVRSFE